MPTTAPTTPTIPCSRTDEGTTAQLTISNPTTELYRIGQMDPSCQEVAFVEVAAGDAWNGTVGNHVVFTVREADDTWVRWFSVPSGSQVSWVETLP